MPKKSVAPEYDLSHPTWQNPYQNYDASWANEPSANPISLRSGNAIWTAKPIFGSHLHIAQGTFLFAYGPGDRRLGGNKYFAARGPYERCCASLDGKIPVLAKYKGINGGAGKTARLDVGAFLLPVQRNQIQCMEEHGLLAVWIIS